MSGITGIAETAAARGSLLVSGRKRMTVVPRPGSEAMVTVPPDCFAKP